MNEAVKPWERVWDIAKFDDLYNRDERFFSVLIKGMLGWLNNNIVLYGKPVKHFFHSTGSSYMYVENNGYYYSMTETSGEDYIYMQMPRCIIELSGINVPTEELTSPFAHGIYERKDGENIRGFYAQMRRIPIELDINLKYVLSNFNESIILSEEIISKLLFQRYFNISFLGQIIRCSIEFPQNFNIELNRVDMTDPTTNQKSVQLSLKIASYYPAIDHTTEIPTDKVIKSFSFGALTNTFISLADGINLHLTNKDGHIDLAYENNEIVPNDAELKDEYGNNITKNDAINKIIQKSGIPEESTLYFGDITNTVDIISRDKILK